MADSSASSNPLGVPVSVWIALLVSAAGVFALTQRPFQDARPANNLPALNYHAVNYGQNVEARLWEDPFTAVALALKDHKTLAPATLGTMLNNSGNAGNADPQTLVLGVMVSGAPYADDVEARRRARNAVLAGLYRSGFLPGDPQHIGYFYFCTSIGAKCSGTDNNTLAAFEWLGSHAAPDKSVLVLWLDQDQFRQYPLQRLSHLFAEIGNDRSKHHSKVSYAVLGPADSDGLREMYDEALHNPAKSDWSKSLQHIVVYSSRATASDASVIGTAATGSGPPGVAAVLSQHSDGQIEFLRTVASDEEVAHAIIEELRVRRIEQNNIVLVAERDTLYARGMGRYFGGCENPSRLDPTHEVRDGSGVRCFTYLKGLDGLGPVPAPASDTASATDAKSGSDKTGSLAEGTASDGAIGPSQLDYLRRLAGTIAGLDSSSFRVQAIGVISSDVYDKLLVLQALREAMPTRTYFTFDLDARLLEPHNLKWTRQLLVGSSLGLALCTDLQGDIAPFRDTYQTTTFFATLIAVHRFDDAAPPAAGGSEKLGCTTDVAAAMDKPRGTGQSGLQWTQYPRVFQIGRAAAYDLHTASAAVRCDVDSECQSIAAVRSTLLWDQRHESLKALLIGLGLAALVLLAGTFALGARALRGRSRTWNFPILGAQRWSNGAVSLGVVMLTLCVALGLWPWLENRVTNHFTRVPTPLFSGANEWTGTVVDVLTLIVVVLFVIRGQRKLHDNAGAVARELGFKISWVDLIRWHRQKLGPGWIRSQCLTIFWFPLRPLPRKYGVSLADAQVSPLEALIAQYLNRGTASARFLRVIATALLSVALLFALELIPGFTVHRRLFEYISLGSLFGMQFLILWTADALLLSRSFILALWRDRPAWPQPTLTKFCGDLGMSPARVTLWLDLRLIALRTSSVSKLVWYPSCVIAAVALTTLMVEFRDFQFANNPIALVAGALFVVASALALRKAAEDVRRGITLALQDDLLCQRKGNPTEADQLEQLIDRVKELREGAFAPYSEQPIVRAVLVPAITYGATVGLQNFRFGS